MGATRELYHETLGHTGEIPKQKQKLELTVTNFGYFYQARLNGERIEKEEFTRLTGMSNFSVSPWHYNEIERVFDFDFYEKDVT